MVTRGALALSIALLGSVIMAAPSAAVDDNVTLTVSPDRIQLTANTSSSSTSGALHVTVLSSVDAQLSVSVADVVADEDGKWVKAPLGSTSYTLDSRLVVSPTEVSIVPSPVEQDYPIDLSIPIASMDQPRVGIVSVTLVPGQPTSGSGMAINQGLGIDTAVVSESAPGTITASSNVKVSLEAQGLDIESTGVFTPVDGLLPDLVPAVVDHGPVTTLARYRNNGDFIVDAQTTFEFATVSPLSALPGNTDEGDVFYELKEIHKYALPGQPASAEGTSLIETPGAAALDTLPFIGFVKVTATTTGTLGPLAAAPVVQSTVFLVFPWKEALALLLVIVLWVLFKRWRRNRRDRRNEPPPVSEVREPVESVT